MAMPDCEEYKITASATEIVLPLCVVRSGLTGGRMLDTPILVLVDPLPEVPTRHLV